MGKKNSGHIVPHGGKSESTGSILSVVKNDTWFSDCFHLPIQSRASAQRMMPPALRVSLPTSLSSV